MAAGALMVSRGAMLATWTGCLLGILLGMRHALEPDHLAAVSTLAVERRGRGAWLGALWGLGHTLALFCVGGALALFEAKMPSGLADLFEFAVALMLIGLGLRAIARARAQGERGPDHEHAHGHHHHHHPGPDGHVHLGRFTFAGRSLAVGLVHGLAGSGALTALVLADLPTTPARLVYIALFGIGSMVGMALLSGLAGWPLERFGKSPRAARMIATVTGALSTALGIFWGGPILFRWL